MHGLEETAPSRGVAHAFGVWIAASWLAVWVGSDAYGQWTLFAPAKQFVCDVGAWILLPWLVARGLRRSSLVHLFEELWETGWPARGLLAFLSWAAATRFWAWVPSLTSYELLRWCLLVAVLALALDDFRHASVRDTVCGWWFGAGVAATVLGLLQWAGWPPRLGVIDPQAGVWFPSVMGYKNPMALALVGQWFLFLGWALRRRSVSRILCLVLLGTELVYLLSLLSRTSWLAWSVGAVVILGWTVVRAARRIRDRAGWLRAGGLGVAMVVALLMTVEVASRIQPRLAQRWQEALKVATIEGLLATDRMTFWRNSIEMVQAEPWGVGLGNWQAAYPVFRVHRPDAGFRLDRQVRRAHNDHLQVLAETGWVGGALWLMAWTALLAGSVRSSGPWLFAQCLVWFAAMSTDYVVIQPFHLLEVLLVWFFVVAASSPVSEKRPSPAVAMAPLQRRLLVAVFCVAAVGGIGRSYRVARTSVAEAKLAVGTGRVRASSDQAFGFELTRLLRTTDTRAFDTVTPTVHQARVQMASLLAAADRPEASFEWAAKTLETAPYDLQALRWIAFASRDLAPDQQKQWENLAAAVERGGALGRFDVPRP